MSNNGTQHWVYGFIATTLVSVLFLIGKSVIANEEKCNDRYNKNVDKIECVTKEQAKVNEGILVALATIQQDLKYIKKEVTK